MTLEVNVLKIETKKAITFDVIDEAVTTVCNGLFANIELKRKTQKTLIDLIALSCIEYHKEGDLKRKIDAYMEFNR